uniref:Putative serine proteinase inhibitor n=1 Tax=Amblyomma parvum TaxID=251391 RepID=A0A023G196_AMBPA
MNSPLIGFVSLFAAAALIPAELRGEHSNERPTVKPECETPQLPFCNLSDSDSCYNKTDILFIFNTTSGLCESTLIDPSYRNNTFKSRFECVSTCNPDQGAPFCAESPWNACNGSTEDSIFVSYFYNITSGTCEEYVDCVESEYKTTDVNGFYDDVNCKFQCEGFNESNVCGSKTKPLEG